MRRIVGPALVTALTFVSVAGLRAQDPRQDGPEGTSPILTSEAYAAVTGLYVWEDGRRLTIFDVVDQTREHQLVSIDPGTGRARTLYPLSDTIFEAGAAWFVREPVTHRIRFGRSANGEFTRVTRLPADETGRDSGASVATGTPSGTVHGPVDRSIQGRKVRFRERTVEFRNGDVRLAGTVVLPTGSGPHPGMVIVHGSGPLTRRVPRYMAELFAHRGIAVLVFDKRGTGASTGEWRGAAHEALAGDAAAAVEALRRQPDVDADRVGLFGSSEGGYVVPVVAARDPRISFIVCRVCPALPQWRVAPDQQTDALRRAGHAEEEIVDAIAFHRRLLAYALNGTDRDRLEADYVRWRDAPWMQRYGFRRIPPPGASFWATLRGVMTVDPREQYRRVSAPVLVVLGERDERLPVEKHRSAFEAVRKASGNRDFSIDVMPDATHGLLVVRTGSDDSERMPFRRFAPRFHDRVVDWVSERILP